MLYLSKTRVYLLAVLAALVSPCVSATDQATSNNVVTKVVSAGGVSHAYRELDQENGGPLVVLLGHLAPFQHPGSTWHHKDMQ